MFFLLHLHVEQHAKSQAHQSITHNVAWLCTKLFNLYFFFFKKCNKFYCQPASLYNNMYYLISRSSISFQVILGEFTQFSVSIIFFFFVTKSFSILVKRVCVCVVVCSLQIFFQCSSPLPAGNLLFDMLLLLLFLAVFQYLTTVSNQCLFDFFL